MADYTQWTEEVYALRLPTNWTEVSKVFSSIRNSDVCGDYDDSVIIDVVDLSGEGNYELQFKHKVVVPR